ncbi:RELT-like protein 2 isoform X3 [Anarhichas minor]|uniref:RELT-like protein 2 isoform X3 n=1 Tax=Anarhichas minor TaxID=65739 RepID=UPI003F741BFA
MPPSFLSSCPPQQIAASSCSEQRTRSSWLQPWDNLTSWNTGACLTEDRTYVMTELEDSGVVDNPSPYIIFVVVFLFFLTGLLGFLVCHLLKKKGYRCRTGEMNDEEEEEKLGENEDDEVEENQDTVEQILKCIIENEANMEAFNEMFGNHVHHDPRSDLKGAEDKVEAPALNNVRESRLSSLLAGSG